MTTVIAILACVALVATIVPLISTQRLTWFQKLLGGQTASPKTVAPPTIENDAGWQLLHSEDVSQFESWLGKDSRTCPTLGNDHSLGSHVLIELFDCDKGSLELEDTVGAAMMDAARASEATIVTDSFHEFKPYGVSGAVIIQESHYTIHTWPEHGYAAVDLFYCGGTIYVDRAVEVLRTRFKPGRIKFLVVRRGIESEVSGR